MTWTCTLLSTEEAQAKRQADFKVGDMFFAASAEDDNGFWPFFFAREKLLSDYYKEHNAHRRPLLVWLPGHNIWCVDAKGFDRNGNTAQEWEVTGIAPKITVSPEISMVGIYRGFIKDGIISDDVEGRKFGPNGERLTFGSS